MRTKELTSLTGGGGGGGGWGGVLGNLGRQTSTYLSPRNYKDALAWETTGHFPKAFVLFSRAYVCFLHLHIQCRQLAPE